MKAPAEVAFDYSEAEWNEIEASIRDLRDGAHAGIRHHLSYGAQQYREDVRKKERLRRAREWHMRHAKQWKKVARLAEQTLESLRIVSSGHPTEHWNCSLEMLENLSREAAGFGNTYNKEDAKLDPPWLSKPREAYVDLVLNTWCELGGQLRISRHPRSEKVQGPLARYFLAVARPVLGTAMLSLESLRDIIDRQKRKMAEGRSKTKSLRILTR
jgi:hypothetical protein